MLEAELAEDEQYDEEGKLIMSPEQQKALEEARRKQAEEHRRALMEKKKDVISKIKKKAKINDTAAGIFSMLGLFIAFIEVENNYDDNGKDRNTSSDWGHGARGIVTVLTGLLLICVVRYHYLEYRIQRERQTSSEGVGSTFFRSINFRWMWVELIYNAIHCPPGFDVEFEFSQLDGELILSLDAICACIMLLRVYIVVRVLKHYTKWSNMHAEEICERYGTESSTIFVLKAIFKEKPYITLSVCMAISIAIFGMATRTFERPYNKDNGEG